MCKIEGSPRVLSRQRATENVLQRTIIFRRSIPKPLRPSPFFSKKVKPKNGLLLTQQGGAKPFGTHQGTGRIFCKKHAKNLHPFPLDDSIFFVTKCLPIATLSKTLKFNRYRLANFNEKKHWKQKRHENNLSYLRYLNLFLFHQSIFH